VTKPHTLEDLGGRRHCLSGGSPGGTTPNTQAVLEGRNDARTGMPPGMPGGAMCVQRFDDSRNSAIHITYRISLRSSSMPEPRDPLLKVLIIINHAQTVHLHEGSRALWRARAQGHRAPRRLGEPSGPAKATGYTRDKGGRFGPRGTGTQ
jgi:hypothetical protein